MRRVQVDEAVVKGHSSCWALHPPCRDHFQACGDGGGIGIDGGGGCDGGGGESCSRWGRGLLGRCGHNEGGGLPKSGLAGSHVRGLHPDV